MLSLGLNGFRGSSSSPTFETITATSATATNFTANAGNGVYMLKHGASSTGIWTSSGGAQLNFDVSGTLALNMNGVGGQLTTPWTFRSDIASGSNGFLLNAAGARLKFSSGGTTDYLSGDGTTTILAGGNIGVTVGNRLCFAGSGKGFYSDAVYVYSENPINMVTGSGVATTASVCGTIQANSTGVGNVGASGPDDLQTYAMAASTLSLTGRGLKITAYGTTANNANAKTVRLMFGATALVTKQLTASVAGTWKIEATILRTGASAQDFYAEAYNNDGSTVASADGATVVKQAAFGTATENEAAIINIKTQSTASTADNDIVSQGLIVEYI